MGDDAADLKKLRADRLRSEIEKNRAGTEEIQKRLNQPWYFSDLGIRISGGLVAIALIVAWAASVLLPLTQTTKSLGEAKLELAKVEKAKADSLLSKAEDKLQEAVAKEEALQTQVKLLTTRLGSTQKRQQEALKIAKDELSNEKSRTRGDANRIRQLAAQVSSLQEDIKSTEIEKKQIKKIAAPYLSWEQVTAMLVEKGFYDSRINPDGTAIRHQYEPKTINGDKVVIDHTTGLTWQQGGSARLSFESAQAYIEKLNRGGYAGHQRLAPTDLRRSYVVDGAEKPEWRFEH